MIHIRLPRFVGRCRKACSILSSWKPNNRSIFVHYTNPQAFAAAHGIKHSATVATLAHHISKSIEERREQLQIGEATQEESTKQQSSPPPPPPPPPAEMATTAVPAPQLEAPDKRFCLEVQHSRGSQSSLDVSIDDDPLELARVRIQKPRNHKKSSRYILIAHIATSF